MAEVASAYVSLIPSAKGFTSGLQRELGGVGKTSGAAASKGFKGSFMSGLRGIAAPMAGLLGVTAGIGFLKDANAEAREAQKIGALTESTIKATGAAAKVTAKQVENLSAAISAKSGIDDEAIQSGANMLLTFKNIRNEAGKANDVFDQTVQATADMAAGMAGGKGGGDIDLKSSSILLGKALNDPVKGLSALQRVGIQFTESQKAINKALVEGGELNALAAFGSPTTVTEINGVMKEHNATLEEAAQIILGDVSPAQQKLFDHYVEGGHALEAQKKILKEVNSQFGGAAAAQATAGEKAAVAWGNLKEQVGTALLPTIDRLATTFTEKVVPAVSSFIAGIQDGTGAGGKFVAVLDGIHDFVKPIAKFIGENAAAIGTFAAVILTAAAAAKVWAAAQALLNVALTANPIGIVVVAVAALAAGLVYAWKKSETFRLGVLAIAKGILFMAEWGVRGFNLLLQAAFKVFEGILIAAEKGLGWIPGLGDKIKSAREAFTEFGDRTTAKLDAVADRIKAVRDGISLIPKSKTFTLNLVTVRSTLNKNEGQLDRFGGFRAHGGAVSPSRYYVVGENGPELFAPRSAGSIIPNHELAAAAGGQVFRGVLSIDRDGVAYIDGVARAALDDADAARSARVHRAALAGRRPR